MIAISPTYPRAQCIHSCRTKVVVHDIFTNLLHLVTFNGIMSVWIIAIQPVIQLECLPKSLDVQARFKIFYEHLQIMEFVWVSSCVLHQLLAIYHKPIHDFAGDMHRSYDTCKDYPAMNVTIDIGPRHIQSATRKRQLTPGGKCTSFCGVEIHFQPPSSVFRRLARSTALHNGIRGFLMLSGKHRGRGC
jgi:hypothetical protein